MAGSGTEPLPLTREEEGQDLDEFILKMDARVAEKARAKEEKIKLRQDRYEEKRKIVKDKTECEKGSLGAKPKQTTYQQTEKETGENKVSAVENLEDFIDAMDERVKSKVGRKQLRRRGGLAQGDGRNESDVDNLRDMEDEEGLERQARDVRANGEREFLFARPAQCTDARLDIADRVW